MHIALLLTLRHVCYASPASLVLIVKTPSASLRFFSFALSLTSIIPRSYHLSPGLITSVTTADGCLVFNRVLRASISPLMTSKCSSTASQTLKDSPSAGNALPKQSGSRMQPQSTVWYCGVCAKGPLNLDTPIKPLNIEEDGGLRNHSR